MVSELLAHAMADSQPTDSSPAIISTMTTTQLSTSIVNLTLPISTKLTDRNFLTWKQQILPTIRGHHLYKYLESPPPSPTIAGTNGTLIANPEYDHWICQDQLLLGWIQASLSESVQTQVISCNTSAELWSTLLSIYSASSRAKLLDLRRQLQSIKKGSSSCTDYIQRIRKISDELTFIGSPVSNEDLVLAVLSGLDADYNALTVALTTGSRRDFLSFADLHGMLLTHEALLSSQASIPSLPSASAPQALLVQSNQSYQNNQGYQKNQGYKNRSQNHKSGSGSFIPQGNPRPSTGILPPPTTKPLNTTTPHSISSQNPPRKQPAPKADATCQICDRYGHLAKHCWYRFDQGNPSSFQAFTAQPIST